MLPTLASFNGQGQLAVLFSGSPSPKSSPQSKVIALVDAETGGIVQTLSPPAMGGFGCMSQRGEFLVPTLSEDQHLDVVIFVAR